MKTVLIADGDIFIQGALKKIIEAKNFQVISCVGTIEDMLQACREKQPDVVFCDIKFSDGNGLKAIERLRAERSDLDFCIISAYVDESFLKDALRMRVKGFLTKPFSPNDIHEILGQLRNDEGDYSEVIRTLQEVVESRNYTKAYYEPKAIALRILEISGRNDEKTAEILESIKTRMLARYVENPFEDEQFMDRFPVNKHFLGSEVAIEMWISNLVDFLYKHRFIERYKSMHSVFSYIDDHIKDYISIRDIVDECHISHQYILRLFKDQMKMSALDYIQNRKMMLAKWYLYFENNSTLNVALKLGYEDGGYFAKVFKKFEGVTPHRYKARLRELYGR
ncbi:MAG: response regulator [Lachnospiraceae bacterium]|nr:response regulator [Lachnospiraceae bacterium]